MRRQKWPGTSSEVQASASSTSSTSSRQERTLWVRTTNSFSLPVPFTGTSLPCASRMSVTAKSPLTGAVGMALSGGQFPTEMKFAGWDVIIVEGKAEKPTYIFVKDGTVKFPRCRGNLG